MFPCLVDVWQRRSLEPAMHSCLTLLCMHRGDSYTLARVRKSTPTIHAHLFFKECYHAAVPRHPQQMDVLPLRKPNIHKSIAACDGNEEGRAFFHPHQVS